MMNAGFGSAREEILGSAYVGLGVAAVAAFIVTAVAAVAGIRLPVSLWWLPLVGVLLSAVVWLLQTRAEAAHGPLASLATRIGTRPFDAKALGIAIAGTALCALFARDWLPVPMLGASALICLSLLRQEGRVERGIPILYAPPVGPEPPPAPTPTPQPGQSVAPANATEPRTFAWEAVFTSEDRASLQITLNVLLTRLQEFRDKNPYKNADPPRRPDFGEFVRGGMTAETLDAAKKLRRYTEDNGWTAYHEVCAVLAMAQSIPYSLDSGSRNQDEYWRYPIETLYDQTGDCEDTSILAACLLLALGHEVAMLLMPGHVAVGVAAGQGFPPAERLVQGTYFYCETTQSGWRVGQVPEDVNPGDIEVVRI